MHLALLAGSRVSRCSYFPSRLDLTIPPLRQIADLLTYPIQAAGLSSKAVPKRSRRVGFCELASELSRTRWGKRGPNNLHSAERQGHRRHVSVTSIERNSGTRAGNLGREKPIESSPMHSADRGGAGPVFAGK